MEKTAAKRQPSSARNSGVQKGASTKENKAPQVKDRPKPRHITRGATKESSENFASVEEVAATLVAMRAATEAPMDRVFRQVMKITTQDLDDSGDGDCDSNDSEGAGQGQVATGVDDLRDAEEEEEEVDELEEDKGVEAGNNISLHENTSDTE